MIQETELEKNYKKKDSILRDRMFYCDNESENKNRLTNYEDFVTVEKCSYRYNDAGNNKYFTKSNDESKPEIYERYFDLFGRIQKLVLGYFNY